MGRLLLLSVFMMSLSIQAQETECPSVSQTTQRFCESNFDPATIADLLVDGTNVNWYATATSTEALASSELLKNEMTYYAGYEGSTCDRQSVLVEIETAPIAGRTSRIYLCSDSGPVDLQKLISPIDDEDNIFHGRPSDPGGYFKGHPFGLNSTIFDPAVHSWDSKQQLRYYTPKIENSVCEQDWTAVFLFITQAPVAGEDGRVEFYSNGEGADLTNFLSEGVTPGGTWSFNSQPHSGYLDPTVDEPGLYTYTVKVSQVHNGPGTNEYYTHTCENTAVLEVIVHKVEEKVQICHKGKTLEVDKDAVQAHLNHGDFLGACEISGNTKTVVSPNPSQGNFNFSNKSATIKKVTILDFDGKKVKQVKNSGESKVLEVDIHGARKGIYFAEVVTSRGKEVIRLIKK